MKYHFLFALLVVLAARVPAQVQYGTFTYHITSEQIIDLGDEEDESDEATARREQMSKMMEQLRASGAFDKAYDVVFTPTAYTYREKIKDKDSEIEQGGITIMVQTKMGDPDHYYTDTEQGTFINSMSIQDRQFLVAGEVEALDWKITGETVRPSEATSGLDLKIATAITAEGDSLRAGFAPSIPVQIAPKNYAGLPGAIITLDVYRERSKTSYTVRNLQLSPAPLELEIPTTGKPISHEKFLETKKKIESRMSRNVIRFDRG